MSGEVEIEADLLTLTTTDGRMDGEIDGWIRW